MLLLRLREVSPASCREWSYASGVPPAKRAPEPSRFNLHLSLVQPVLDIDLDFFVENVVYWPDNDTRPDPEEHPVWSETAALRFLREQCGLQQRLPGFITENHGDLFSLWRSAIAAGTLTPPFHVTHVDAHADLGLGDAGYVYLLDKMLLLPVEDRTKPPRTSSGLTDGNHLAYAIACRWIAELDYVFCPGGGSDELSVVMQDHDPKARFVQLSPMTLHERAQFGVRGSPVIVDEPEPAVPYRSVRAEDFVADGAFDFICLTRSPPYTPATADRLFDVIREEFIEGD